MIGLKSEPRDPLPVSTKPFAEQGRWRRGWCSWEAALAALVAVLGAILTLRLVLVAPPPRPALVELTPAYFDMSDLQRHAMTKPGQRFLTLTDFLTECAAFPGCMLPGHPSLAGDEVWYIGMTGSTSKDERLGPLMAGWGNALPRLMFFADVADPNLRVFTFPAIEGLPTWQDAQHRQPRALQWLFEEPQFTAYDVGRAKWFVFVDDDTWVNVEALHKTLSRLNWNTRLAMGYVWHEVYSDMDHFSGGAGIVLSAPLAREVARRLYREPGCMPEIINGHVWNDVFLSTCIASIPGSTVVHSTKFHASALEEMLGSNHIDPGKVFDAFTFHKVFGDRHAILTSVQRDWQGGGYPASQGIPLEHVDMLRSFVP